MGIFNDYTREGKGVDKGIDNRIGIVIFFDIYFRKFWKLITINLMYVLFCIPIFTIGPATAGITKILRNYAREEHAFLWIDFWDTFKQNLGKSIAVFFIDLFGGALLVFDFYMYTAFTGPAIFRVIALATLMLSATILLFMNYYIYIMMVTFKLNFKQLLKNAFLFAWIGFWRNLLITFFLALLLLFVLMYFPSLGSIFLLLLFFSTSGLIINFIAYPLIKKHMIDGHDPVTGEKIEE